jgi:hypothetical protein
VLKVSVNLLQTTRAFSFLAEEKKEKDSTALATADAKK